MDYTDYIPEKLIWLGKNFSRKDELFSFFSSELLKSGFVKDSFYTKIVQREKNYPTGLKLADYSVAIPHANPDSIKQSFVAIITLKKPVAFSIMDDSTKETPVGIVFVLGLKKSEEHMYFLQRIIQIIKNKQLINDLKKCSNPTDAAALIKNHLKQNQTKGESQSC